MWITNFKYRKNLDCKYLYLALALEINVKTKLISEESLMLFHGVLVNSFMTEAVII